MKKGLSLVEVMLSFLIFSIVIACIFAVLRMADLNWDTDLGLLDLQQEGRQAIDGMTREIRQSKPQDITINASGSRVDFYIPNVSNIIGYYLLNNQIIREHPAGTTKVLANFITSLSFCCLGGANCQDCANAQVLQIQVAGEKTVNSRPLSLSLTEKVVLRNE